MTEHPKLKEIPAPKIDGTYPSRGAMGGAWNIAYAILAQAERPIDLKSLAQVVHALHPECSVISAEDLIHKAASEALLTRGKHYVGGRERTTVKIR